MAIDKFSTLSTETLHQIFSYFCLHCCSPPSPPHEHQRATPQDPHAPSWHSQQCHTLFSVCLVSGRFCNVAQPILYHEFIPGYGDSWRSTVYSWDGRLTTFMRTVARRRDLAATVKRIYFHPLLLKPIDVNERQVAVKEALHALQVMAQSDLVTDHLVALSIALLPNLQHCSLEVFGYRPKYVPSSALQDWGVSELPLKSLDIAQHLPGSFGVACSPGENAPGILEVATHLETLNIHMGGGFWRKAPFRSLLNLRTVRITHSRFLLEDLIRLLLACDSLQSFTYESSWPRNSPGGCVMIWGDNDHFKPLEAVLQLRGHRYTLQSLHLDFRRRVMPIPRVAVIHSLGGTSYLDREEPVIDFHDFTALQHLFIDPSQIFHWYYDEPPPLAQLLPPSIVSLHLADEDHYCQRQWLVNGMFGLASAISRGQLPNLKEVRCGREDIEGDDSALIAAFVAAGVDFGYGQWALSKPTLNLPSDIPPPRLNEEARLSPLPDEDDPDL